MKTLGVVFGFCVTVVLASSPAQITVGSVWEQSGDWKFDANFDITLTEALQQGYRIILEFDQAVQVTAVWQFRVATEQSTNTATRCWRLMSQTWNPTFTSGQHVKSGMQVVVTGTLAKPSGTYGTAYIEGTKSSTCSSEGPSNVTISPTEDSSTQAATTRSEVTAPPKASTESARTPSGVTDSTCSGPGCEMSTTKYTVTTSGQCKCTCPAGNN